MRAGRAATPAAHATGPTKPATSKAVGFAQAGPLSQNESLRGGSGSEIARTLSVSDSTPTNSSEHQSLLQGGARAGGRMLPSCPASR